MASGKPGGLGILQQLTPLGRRLLSGGSVMESAMAPNGRASEDRKSGLRPLHLQLISKTPPVADPRVFSLVNPFRTKDEPIEVSHLVGCVYFDQPPSLSYHHADLVKCIDRWLWWDRSHRPISGLGGCVRRLTATALLGLTSSGGHLLHATKLRRASPRWFRCQRGA